MPILANRGAVVAGELSGAMTPRIREDHKPLSLFERDAVLTDNTWRTDVGRRGGRRWTRWGTDMKGLMSSCGWGPEVSFDDDPTDIRRLSPRAQSGRKSDSSGAGSF